MIAAIYARKSTEETGVADDQKSTVRQVEHARAYAARKGWTVRDASVYVDNGISGAEFAKRPGFLRLMNALKPRPAFQALIMSEESRLGRESIETAYALKQLITAGVRVFFYLEDRERTLDSPIEKIMLSLTTFADELEREKARQRTYDAITRKAKAGHVTGGRCFGYRNVEVRDVMGKRSHVDRTIDDREAAVIRRIFELSAAGHGQKAIAKRLNADGEPSPLAQRGRSSSWAPTSVREVLFRSVYRGTVAWNRTRKRDRWGLHRQTPRPPEEWLDVPAPALRIVTDEAWAAAHARLEAVRGVYMAATGGRAFGRPALGDPSKYLLTNLATCGVCGGTMRVRSRSHGDGRTFFYGCSGYHERGKTVCANGADVPMTDADDIVIEALLDDVLDPTIVEDAVDEALCRLQGDRQPDQLAGIEAAISLVERERERLIEAIAVGGGLAGLLEALRTRETKNAELQAARQTARAERSLQTLDVPRVKLELQSIATSWRTVLAGDPVHARPIVSSLLVGRVTIRPTARKRWTIEGEGTLAGLFSGDVFPAGWRPHRDSSPAGIPFTRTFAA